MTGRGPETPGIGRDELALAARAADQKPRSGMSRIEEHPDWVSLGRIPMLLTAGVALPRFRVRDLVSLAAGQTVVSASPSSDDVPVKVGATHLAWSEFEVVGQRMAVRLTRLA